MRGWRHLHACSGTKQKWHTGLTLDFRISPCCRGRVEFRTLVCHSRSHPSPKCTLLPFYIPNFRVPFSPDPPFALFSTPPSFVLPFFCSIPFLQLSFLSSSQKLFSILVVSLKLHFPVLHSYFLAPSLKSCLLYIVSLEQHVHLVLLLIIFGYFPL